MIRRAKATLLAAAVSGLTLFGACGDDLGSRPIEVGSFGLHIDGTPGLTFNVASYEITGPGGFSRSATIDVSHSASISVTIDGIPVGGPYGIALSATATDGTTCGGSATFNIAARVTVPVNVHLTCHQGARSGSVMVNGTINVCPVADGIGANPTEITVGGSIALDGKSHDADNGPSAVSYVWSASSGSFDSTTAKAPTFTCTTAGPVTITLTVSDGDPTPACTDTLTATVTCSKSTTTLAVFGDWPYSTALAASAPSFIAQVNADPDVDLALFLGDIHSGSMPCTAAWNSMVFGFFQSFADPFVYTPGDNEWTDCHKPKESSSGYPPDELAKDRQLFFPNPGKTIGGVQKNVVSQALAFDPLYPDDAAFVENVLWEQANVLFVTLNLPGSNNDLLPWTGTFSNPAAQADEVAKRNAANSRWLARAFAQATTDGSAGIVIGLQADMWDPAAFIAGGDGLNGYDAFVQQLATLTVAYGKPVLLFNGDSHLYESDHPLADPTSATGIMHPVAFPVPNLTRITVDGSTNFKDWVKLTVDPSTAAVFSWTRVFTP